MHVTIFTDASFCQDTRVCAFGYYIVNSQGRREGARGLNVRPHYPHEAEALAIANALYQAIKYKMVYVNGKVLVRTDSTRAIEVFKKQVTDLTWHEERALNYFLKVCKSNNLQYDFVHIKAHSGVDTPEKYAHDKCDRFALKKMRILRHRYLKEKYEKSRKQIAQTYAGRRRKK